MPNLQDNLSSEYSYTSAMVLLDVPYRSQEDADAGAKRNDCGPACAAMNIQFSKGQIESINVLSMKTPLATSDTGITCDQVAALLNRPEYNLHAVSVNGTATMQMIKDEIDAGKPPILLIRYGAIPCRQNVNFTGGHFVVAVGYDDDDFFLNDPDWWSPRRNEGHNFPVGALALENAVRTSPGPWSIVKTAIKTTVTPGDEVEDMITTDSCNIRSIPSISGALVGSIPANRIVQVQGSWKDPDSAHTYTKLLKIGEETADGFISRTYLTPYVPGVAYDTYYAVAPAGVRIRELPSTSSSQIGFIAYGAGVETIQGQNPTGSGYYWRALRDGGFAAEKQVSGPDVLLSVKKPPDVSPVPPSGGTVYVRGTMTGFNKIQGGIGNDTIIAGANQAKGASHPFDAAVVVNEYNLVAPLCSLIRRVIYRWQPGDNDNPPQGQALTEAYGYSFAEARWNDYANIDARAYIQITNEYPWHTGLNEFWIGIMKFHEGKGRKSAILNFAIGHPTDDEGGMSRQAKWNTLRPCMERAKTYGHIFSFHVYAADGTPAGQLSAPNVFPYFEGRVPTLMQTFPDSARPASVVTELAREFHRGTFDGKDMTLQHHDKAIAYFKQFPWFVGSARWVYGAAGWGDASNDSMWQDFVAATASGRW